MKVLAATAIGLFIIAAVHARQSDVPSKPYSPAPAPAADSGDWKTPLSIAAVPSATPRPSPAASLQADMADDIDVVDAHWMALTMWGEARGQGEDGMRAVGHVIHNRWLTRKRGAYVTDTVSQAWQFSCWNQDDPNRRKMLDIALLRTGSEEHGQWLAAQRISAEILSGHSSDPTGGALFYHAASVQPRWSRGQVPVATIGDHLFFATAA